MKELLAGNVLVVGAHADDIEIGCGGTVQKLKAEGATVIGLVVTDTHYVRDGVVHRDSEVSRDQARKAAEILGYDIFFGTERNNDVKVSSQLVYFIRDYIEKYKINTIFTHWDGDAHLDHRNVALATMMASRDPRNLLMYRTNLYVSPDAFRANLYVDIGEYLEPKMKALSCYQAELERLGPDSFSWVEHANRAAGTACGTKAAEEFQVVKYYSV